MAAIVMTPLEAQKKEFRKAFRGYNEDEVDAFFGKILKDYENLYKENLDLKEQLEQKEGNIFHYRKMEETLHNTLIIAEKTAEDLKKNAEKEAEIIFRNAQAKSAEIVAESEQRAKEILDSYQDIRKEAEKYRVQFRAMLLAQMEVLDQMEAAELRRQDSAGD